MTVNFVMVERGAVRVNLARFTHLSESAFLLHVDCAQKYPEFLADVSHESEGDDAEMTLRVLLYPTEDTLHVPEDAPRDEHGKLASTVLELRGLRGDWFVMSEHGKWGPYICGLRAVPRDETWPEYAEVDDAGREEG